jgi:SAM-dependent methyltransferase
MSRNAYLMQSINKTDKLIEIGPSLNPLAPKADGWHAFSIDHADQDGLRAKYKDDARVDGSKIERVDFVWTSGSLSDAVPAEHMHSFDVFLASHVIEHYPDVVDFLTSADRLTKPQGRMVLAVPDKRLCFDMFRSVSSTGEAIAAHLEKRSRHTCANVFDFTSKAVMKNGLPGWQIGNTVPVQPTTMALELAHAHAMAAAQAVYVDAHGWVFCPASFELMLLELARLGYTDWRVERCEAQAETEFFAWLVKGGQQHYQAMSHEALFDLRQALMKRLLCEQAEQLHTIGFDDISALGLHPGVNNLTTTTAVTSALAAAEQKASALQAELNLIKGSRVWRLRTAIRQVLAPEAPPAFVQPSSTATAPVAAAAAKEEAAKPVVDTLDQYVTTLPTEQNAFDLFKGEWTSDVPVDGVASGHAALFKDGRIPWFLDQIGDCTGYRALELGPLEGGHTHMLEQANVKSVVAVEANQRAFLKCLIVQNALQMRKAHFLLGDFQEYLAAAQPASFDITVASGVLYHMRDPARLIKNLCRVSTKAILLWTHYYDAALIAQNPDVVTSKFGDTVASNVDGVDIESTEFLYQTSLEWSGFCGGSKMSAQWLRRQDIAKLFENYGWRLQAVTNDDTQHSHGPAFTGCFVRAA